MSSEAVASAPHGALPNLAEVPEEIRDQVWLDTYYQGDSVKQLTVRAVVMGSILGMMMSLSNLYIGLKTGWGLGVAITSCILSYAIWTVFLKFGWAKQPMSILENNCMQSTATSAGVSTGGTMVSAIAAQLMLTGVHMNWKVLMAWTAFLAFLGVSMAIPMKRQLINREQLKFPSGIAAAETLRSLHASGGEALIKAQALFWSMGIGALLQWWQSGMAGLLQRVFPVKPGVDGFPLLLPMEIELSGMLRGKQLGALGFVFPVDPLMTAAGMIVGMRTSLSMVISGFALFGIVGPWLEDSGVLREMYASGALSSETLSSGNIRKWGLWTGSSMMVAAGLTAALFQWKSMVAGISKLGALFSGKKQVAAHDPIAHIEVPNSWFVIGTGISGLGCIIIMYTEWDIPLHWGIVAVAMAFVLSLVACRATGETDTTPIGAMGKVTQLFYGAAIPNQPIPNLMTAGVTAGAAGAAADLLTDLKSGYLLGANSRQQTIAQSIGIISGTLAIVPAWYLFVPDASALGTSQFPAPAAEVWKSVAELLSRGISTMHPTILSGIIFGGSLGFLLTLTEGLAPKNLRKYLPSATGLGLGMVIPFGNSFSFLLGALITVVWTKLNEASCEQKMVPIASGIVAGCSLMAVFIMILQAAGLLPLG
jgi:OPT family oligopeptide transporter